MVDWQVRWSNTQAPIVETTISLVLKCSLGTKHPASIPWRSHQPPLGDTISQMQEPRTATRGQSRRSPAEGKAKSLIRKCRHRITIIAFAKWGRSHQHQTMVVIDCRDTLRKGVGDQRDGMLQGTMSGGEGGEGRGERPP